MGEHYSGDRAALLTPVLDGETARGPIYSARAEFFTAFFGGPFAILGLSGMNASLLGRLRADFWRYGLAGLASLALVVWMAWLAVADPQPRWLTDTLGAETQRGLRWSARVLGLLVWFVLWFPYRRYHKTAELMGIEPRKPWVAAITCVVGATALQFLIIFAAGAIARPGAN